MSQVTSAPIPSPDGGAAVSAGRDVIPEPPSAAEQVRARARGVLQGTPGRMLLAGVLVAVSCLLYGIAGLSLLRGWDAALQDARVEAAQLVRIQTVQNDLVKADAAASNSYLAGGQAAASVRQEYNESIARAAGLLAEAAVDGRDSDSIATATVGLTEYTGYVAQAQANNVQGLEVGAAYLRQAGTVLREKIVPALEAVSKNDQRRVADAYQRMNYYSAALFALAGFTVIVLVAVQTWLARRVRRIVNVPMAGATVAVLASAALAVVAVAGAAGQARATADGAYQATVSLASARTAAFDAKAQESLGLIARGDASEAEAIASAQIVSAGNDLQRLDASRGSTVAADLQAWVDQHTAVRDLDDRGDWQAAKELALSSSNEAFTVFDTSSAAALDAQAAQVSTGLRRPQTLLLLVGWLTLLSGLGAAAACMVGIERRLGEYR